jgi:preprotein translocase subunit SecA
MRLFNSSAAESLMGLSNVPDELAKESRVVSRAIRSAQGQVEARNAEIRKNVLKYDDVLNRQREAIYGDRRRILEGDDLHDRTQNFLQDVITAVLDEHTSEGHADDWDLEALWNDLKLLYPIGVTLDELVHEVGGRNQITRPVLEEEILSDARLAYERRTESLGEPAMRELERRVVLSVIDRRWRDHLYEMDYLKDGIGLRAMAQRDPLVEYQREGFSLFQTMMEQIREESIGFLFNLEVEVNAGGDTTAAVPQVAAKGLSGAGAANEKLSYSAPSDAGGVEVRNQRGQIEQAATAKARQAQAEAEPGLSPAFGGRGGASGGQQGGAKAAPPAGPAPSNRAERRAQERKRAQH